MKRRRMIALTGTALLGGASGLGYCLKEAGWLNISHRTIPVNKPISKSLKLLHLSDLHLGTKASYRVAHDAILAGLQESPDVICLTGDFITRKLYNEEQFGNLLQLASRSHPTYACLGNHDGGAWAKRHFGYSDSEAVASTIQDAGVTLLRNSNDVIEFDDVHLQLIGLDDIWSGTMDVEFAFKGTVETPDTLRIVLAHNPDVKDSLQHYPWDLMLSGHTHGGQIRIPGLGAPVLPVKDRRYIHGTYTWNKRRLHVSCGVGSIGGIRFNCPPEVCLLHIQPPEAFT